MFDRIGLGRELFAMLTAVDVQILERTAAGMCQFCGGPLHRGDFSRKPRGGLLAAAGEVFTRRFSLCCGREGCRRRTTPPSVRFLGRRVYLGAVVILASVIALAAASARACERVTGVAPRTLRRWARWWRGPFIATPVFADLSSRIVADIPGAALPTALLVRFPGEAPSRVAALLAWLTPLTTASAPDNARLVRGIAMVTMKSFFTQKMA
jgi:hypothetical protein